MNQRAQPYSPSTLENNIYPNWGGFGGSLSLKLLLNRRHFFFLVTRDMVSFYPPWSHSSGTFAFCVLFSPNSILVADEKLWQGSINIWYIPIQGPLSLLIHLFHKHLLITEYVPSNFLSVKGSAVNQTDKIRNFREQKFQVKKINSRLKFWY